MAEQKNDMVLKAVLENKIIAIVRGVYGDDVLRLSEALLQSGIRMIEVTYDQTGKAENTADTIRLITEHFAGDVLAGAGTVMSAEQARIAKDAGARYIISPNVKEEVIRETKKLNMASMPGALTPTEIAAAYEMGADVVKIFPASVLGPAYIKAVKAPLKHIPVMAVGGINEKNARDYIAAGAAGVGVGGNLVNRQWVSEGKFDEIGRIARELRENVFC